VFQHADKSVRSEASALLTEISRWTGSAFLGTLQGLKPVQLKELQESCGQQQATQPSPTRYLRSQKPAFTAPVEMDVCMDQQQALPDNCLMEVAADGVESVPHSVVAKPSAPLDAYDIAEAADILSALSSAFYEALSSASWKERKEALDNLLPKLRVARIAEGRYSELVDALCKRIADVNVMVVISAANCLEALAQGLRAGFAHYRSPTIVALLDRCKEKKQTVLEALRAALDALKFCCPHLSDAFDDVSSFLTHKNPSVKSEALLFLSRQLKLAKQPPSKKDCKALVELVLPTMDDGVTDVREAASEVLACVFKVLGEPAIGVLLEKLDKLKLNKVKELASKAELACLGGSVASTLPTQVRSAAPPAVSSSQAQQSSTVPSRKVSVPDAPLQAAHSSKSHETADETAWRLAYVHTDEEALRFFNDSFGEELVQNLVDAAWKTRLQAIEDVFTRIDASELPLGFSTELFARFFSQRPGWKESNFQVLGKVISCLIRVAKEQFYTKEASALAIAGLVEKLSDPKLRQDCGELFMIFAEQVSLGFTIAQVVDWAKAQKSPKIQADIVKWIQTAIQAFGITGCRLASLVDLCKTCLCNSNPTVRNVAVSLSGTLRAFVGADIRLLFNDLNSAILASLDAEFARIANEPAIVPTRQSLGSIGQSAVSSALTPLSSATGSRSNVAVDDLIPRVNITADISDSLLTKLGDASWKTRKEALDEIGKVLAAANYRIKYSGSDLFSALKARLNDANKNLAVQALDLCGQLAESLGTAFDKSVRIILPAVIDTLSDNKIQVRQAALKALDKFHSVCPTSALLSSIGQSVVPDSPNLRKEILQWTAVVLSAPHGSIPKEELLEIVGSVTVCLQDRAGEVRKAAQNLIVSMLDHISAEAMKRACVDQQPKLVQTLQPVLEANRGRVKPVAPAPVPASSISASAPNSTAPKTPQRTMSVRAPGNKPMTPIKPSASLHSLSEESRGSGNDECPLLSTDISLKQARSEKDKGTQKWSFEAPRKDIIDFLREQMLGNVSYGLVGKLFSDDFKDHIIAMNRLEDYLQVASDDETKAKFLANMDLLLKYLTLRFFDTNTSVLLKALELSEGIIKFMDNCNYRLSEYEASSFLPFLINKMGDGKEVLRLKIHGIFRQICRIYPASKLFLFFMDGLKNKNSRTRSECLEELANLLSRNGPSVLQTSRHLPLIGALIADRDSHVRNGALNVLVHANNLLGSANLQKHLQNLSAKDLDMLEERLKRAAAGVPLEDIVSRDVEMAEEASQPIAPLVDSLSSQTPVEQPVDKGVVASSLLGPDVHGLSLPTPVLPSIRRSFEPSMLSHPLDQAIDQIQFSTDLVCIHALQQLETALNAAAENESTDEDVKQRVDALSHALVVRLKEATSIVIDIPEIAQLKSRLCRYVTNALVLVAANPVLCRELSQDLVELMLSETLAALVSDRLPHFEDHEQLERALNILVVKSLENVPQNQCYRALLSILSCVFRNPPEANDKFPELVMKCLWKMTKQLGGHLGAGRINTDELLLDVHSFLATLPPVEWKMRTNDKLPFEDLPLRTVKTILHELVQAQNLTVLTHLSLIPEPEESFVVSYLRAMLAAKGFSPEQVSHMLSPVESPDAMQVDEVAKDECAVEGQDKSPMEVCASGPTQLSVSEIECYLREVCTQICSRPDTRLGLQQLYEFRKAHPYAQGQISAFLSSLGDFFHKYISRALERLDMEQQQRMQAGTAASFGSASAAEVSVEAYKSKLVQLRQQIFGEPTSMAVPSYEENQPPSSPTGGSLRRASTLYESPKMRSIRTAPESSGNSQPTTPTKLSMAMDLATSAASTFDQASGSPNGTSSILSLKERLAKLRGESQLNNQQ
jgi:cytoskeleton-associated protein 5